MGLPRPLPFPGLSGSWLVHILVLGSLFVFVEASYQAVCFDFRVGLIYVGSRPLVCTRRPLQTEIVRIPNDAAMVDLLVTKYLILSLYYAQSTAAPIQFYTTYYL